MKTIVKKAEVSELIDYFPGDILAELGIDLPKPKAEPKPEPRRIEQVTAPPPTQEEAKPVTAITDGMRARDKFTGLTGTIKTVELFGGRRALTLVLDNGEESPDCYYPEQLEVA